tara:strand:- start:252 stop:464 length:213 start_codon:yes stop_codon:yes gene_type:complete
MDYNDVRALNEKIHQLESDLQKYQSVDLDDINKLVSFANQMQYLLEECRNEQIDYKLAKQIDYLFKELDR